jgi:hypothetical protein
MKIEPDWYRYLFGSAFLIWFACWLCATFRELCKEYRRRGGSTELGGQE